MSSPDYGPVVKSLERVIESVESEILDDDCVVLETLVRFVGGFNFRRKIPAEHSVEFNLDMAGNEVVVDALVADPPETGEALVSTSAAVHSKREKVAIYFPEAEECLKEAFDKTGGVHFIFVGPGFFQYLQMKGLMKDECIGSARVVMKENQPDRDVFLVGHLEGAITDLTQIPKEKLARITIITEHPGLSQRLPQLGSQSGPGSWRLLSLQEQREFLSEMSETERDVTLANVLQNVPNGTAKATLRNLFPGMPEEELLRWFYKTLRKLRPKM